MRAPFTLLVRAFSLGFLVLLLSACLPGSGMGDFRRVTKPTLRLGSTNFREQLVLAELYGQALEARGYKIDRQLSLGSRETVFPALESGRIDLYPEYLATLLAFVTRGGDLGSPDPAVTHRNLSEALKPLGVSVLNYAAAVNTNGFVVTQSTADKYHLTTVSDLAAVAPQLVLGASPECPVRPFCLPGLRQTYGIAFKNFRALDPGGPLTVSALESGQIDVGVLFTTDPLITSKDFVLLADDRSLQLADNVAPVIRTDVVSSAPTDLQSTINDVSARLTTAELTGLNAQLEIERKEPRDAAATWLKAQGLGK